MVTTCLRIWSCLQDVKFGELIFDEIKTRCLHYITGQVIQQAYTIREESMLIPQSVWHLKLEASDSSGCAIVGACVRWSEIGMSTRLWTIQYIMVTRAVTRYSSRGSQSIRSSIAEIHYWCSHSLPLCVGPIPHFEYSMMGHFFIATFFPALWTGGDHDVCLWRDTPVCLAVSACWGRSFIYTRNNISALAQFLVVCLKSQVLCVMISLQD